MILDMDRAGLEKLQSEQRSLYEIVIDTAALIENAQDGDVNATI
jgi:hypothetical protein